MPRGQAWQSKQGNPFQPVQRRILLECAVKPVGVRAIPADHDVYPIGDEPLGAMIQTEPSFPSLARWFKEPFRTRLLFTMSTEQADTQGPKSHEAANLFFLFG